MFIMITGYEVELEKITRIIQSYKKIFYLCTCTENTFEKDAVD